MMKQQLPALHEDEITRTALGFLKGYYRQRHRAGNTELISDVRGAGGIVADGFLRFPLPDGNQFIATIESTSLAKKNEVLYKQQTNLLRWDAAATGAVLATLVFTIGFIQNSFTVETITLLGCLALIGGVFTIGYYLFIWLFGRWRRYRYIYAIQQFKQYFANEQWIAISENLFSPNVQSDASPPIIYAEGSGSDEREEEEEGQNPYYEELINQCIINGVGLLIIRHNAAPIIKITPSRQDLFKDKRRRIRLFSEEELSRFTRLGNYPEWMKGFKMDDVRRFQRKYQFQVISCLLCTLIISAIFYKEFEQQITEVEVDRAAYLKEMADLMARNSDRGYPTPYYLDTPYVWPRPVLENVDGYAIGLGLKTVEQSTQRSQASQYRTYKRREGFLTLSDDYNDFLIYDCSRLYNMEGTSYIVQEGVYPDFETAMGRIQTLRAYEFDCSGLLLNCFDEVEKGYAVYFGLIYKDLGDANRALATYEALLGDNTLSLNMKLRSLSPK
jgi:hypothetical protein